MVNFVQFVAYFVSNTTIPADTIWFEYPVPESDIEYLAAKYVAYTMTIGTSESDPGARFRNLSRAQRSQKVRHVVNEWKRTHPHGSLDAYVPFSPMDALVFSQMENMNIGSEYTYSKKARYVQHVSGDSTDDPPNASQLSSLHVSQLLFTL